MKIMIKSITAFSLFAKTANASNATRLDDGQIATTAIFSFFGGLAILTSGLYCCQAVRRWREELKQVQQMPNMRTAKVTPINSPLVAVASIVVVHQTPPIMTISQNHNIITSPA